MPVIGDVDLKEYGVVNPEIVAVTKILAGMWEKLGRPDTPFTESGAKLMEILISSWYDLFPEEAKEWEANRKDYKTTEMTTKQHVKKHTGRSLASYPMYIYKVMKRLFIGFDPTERKNCFKMVKKWPMFQFTNQV